VNMFHIKDCMYSHFKCKANDICTRVECIISLYILHDTIK
jgi:hypothetical protein